MRTFTIGLAAGLLLLMSSIGLGQLPNPALTQVFPPGAQVGQSVPVTVAGRDLDEGTRLLFSHPGIIGSVRTREPGEFETAPQPLANQFDVEVSSNVPPGRYDVRVVGRFGVSTPRTFLVDTVPQLVEPGGNHSREKAPEIPHNVSLYGRADGAAIDYFKLTARQGQSLIIECLAQEIDSQMRPVVVVWDESGKQLRRSRQLVDPLVEFTAPVDGTYYIGVHDHVFAGGGEFVYRLQVFSRPYVAYIWPPVGRRQSSQMFELVGRNLPDAQPSPIRLGDIPLERRSTRIFVPETAAYDAYGQLAATQSLTHSTFAYQWHSRAGSSNVVRLGLTSLPITVEQEDNDHPKSAQRIAIPGEYVGTFYPRRDQDWVEFAAKQGESLHISVLSHRLGHDTDPEIFVQKVVTDDQGAEQITQVKTRDDNDFDATRYRQRLPRALDLSHRDPDVTFQADADAIYRLGLRDLFGGSRDDPRAAYRLLIRGLEPDYQAIAWTQRQAVNGDTKVETASACLRQGGVLPVYVHVLRRGGFNGEIHLLAEDLPAGVTSHASIIGPNQRDGVLVLEATDTAAGWQGPIRILARAKLNGKPSRRVARGAVLLSDTPDVRNARPHSRLTNDFVLAVVADDPAPVTVRIGNGEIIETSIGAKLEIPLTYRGDTDVKGELNLAAIGIPNDVKAADVKLAADAKEAKVQLTLDNKNAPVGLHTFFMRGKVKLGYARNPQAIVAAEKQRQDFAALLQKLTEQEQSLAKKVSEAKQIAEAEAEVIGRFAASQSTTDQTLQQATQLAQTATQQLKDLQNAAASSRSDSEINKAVIEAEAAVSLAVEQLKSAQQSMNHVAKRLDELRVRLTASQQEVATTEETRQQIAERKQRAEEFKKTLDQRVEEGKKNWGAKDIDAWVDSNPIAVRILRSPIRIEFQSPEYALNRDGQHPLAISLERRFGFDDEVQLELKLPESAQGISAESIRLSKDQQDTDFTITVAKDATPGTFQCAIQAKLKFNGLEIADEIPLTLNIP